ncbi:MAG: hypothetical protein FWD89_01580 [Firmicutes bacterium]|nr:hypothetical protein [Bacillota bacterium]MCL2770981.1 hypothetical protein [Bacillota bacterium]
MANVILELERAEACKKLINITAKNLKDPDGLNQGYVVRTGICLRIKPAANGDGKIASFYVTNSPRENHMLNLNTKDIIDAQPVRRGMVVLHEIKEDIIELSKNKQWKELESLLDETFMKINLRKTKTEIRTMLEGIKNVFAGARTTAEETATRELIAAKFQSTDKGVIERTVVYTSTVPSVSQPGKNTHRFLDITSPNMAHFSQYGEDLILDIKRTGVTISAEEFKRLCEEATANCGMVQGKTTLGTKNAAIVG